MTKSKLAKTIPSQKNYKAVARISTAPPLTGKRKPLKAREARFVEIWCNADGTKSGTDVAKEAGYPDSYAHVMGSRLTNPEVFPNVVAAIQRRQAELNAKHGTTFERHMKDLLMIRDKAIEAGAWSAAVQAEYRRGQALGQIYIDRKEIRHGTIDSMSKEEVQRKLDALRKIYQASPEIVDVEDTQVVKAIENEKTIDHSEEFIDEAGSEFLSEDEEGDDDDEDHPGRIVDESRDT
jgi:phage terminase small subunit